ncbi:MAG: PDZ domain-containing protein [Firmicutes bacterium]|nr:PDZ domain-containing protein [Bacillota bacterium]
MSQKIKELLLVISSLFLGIIGTLLVVHYVPVKTEMIEKPVAEVNITESDTIQSGVKKIYNAVVVIESYKSGKLMGSGTGFVYKKDDNKGYIITNYHVISGASYVKVVNANNDVVEAQILGGDEYEDIAVLSIDASMVLDVATMGSSEEADIGDTLFTVGTPVGSEYMGTVTKGILSGKDRTVTVDLDNGGGYVMQVLQTDAAINPGNSGGPLCNINGEVIGVNSLKLVEDTIEGMGFAIPIELVMTSIERLEKGKPIVRPVLGIESIDVSNTYALYRHNILLDDEIESGVVIINVLDNSPAKSAGLVKGDIILEIEGNKTTDSAHLKYILYKYTVGDSIKVKYYRDGNIKEVTVNLTKSAVE